MEETVLGLEISKHKGGVQESGNIEGEAQVTHDWGKPISPARMDLRWTGQLCGSLLMGVVGSGGNT